MKKGILITILLALFFSRENLSQEDPILNDLNDPDIWKRENALTKIRQHKLVEYIPVLVEKTFEQSEPVMIKNFMKTLAYLDYTDIDYIAHAFIEMADEFVNMFPKADPLEMKVTATEILFNAGDYSTVDYVFQLAERDYPFDQTTKFITISMLGRIINDLPTYEEDAKEILTQSVNNSPNNRVRAMALSLLFEKYGYQLVDFFEAIISSDDDWNIRAQCLEILHEINFTQLNDLLRGRITIDLQPEMRDWIADYLLTWFGKPSDLKYLQDYLPYETDQTTIVEISVEISTFIPPKPDTLDYYGLANRLITYTNELLQYGWIANGIIRAFYETKLNDIIEAIQGGKYGKACNIINNTLLPTIEQHLSNGNITTEGYKFLHYYTIYIKEEIEEQYGACP